MTTFNKYAKYYDLLYKDKNYKKEVDFFLKTLRRSHFSGKKILSLGSGTCTYEILLADKGYLITGIDISKQMVDLGREKVDSSKLSSKIKLCVGDIRKINVKGKFDMVMCMFNVIGYQNTNQDLDSMLKGVSKHLKKGGAFFFDFWHNAAVIKDNPTKREKTINLDGAKIVRKTTPLLIPTKNILQISFEVKEYKRNKLVESAEEKHTMRYFSIPELEYFLNKSGMVLEKVYNFLDLKSKVGDDKWNLFILAKKQ